MKKALSAATILISLSGCATLSNMGIIGSGYRGIPNTNKYSNTEILAKADTFATKYNLKRTGTGSDYSVFAYLNYWDGTVPTTCKMQISIDNDTINAMLNPCRIYFDASRGWGDFSNIPNQQRKQAILNEFYYRYLDPKNPASDSILKSNNLPQFISTEQMNDEINKRNAIYKRYNVSN